MRAAVTPASTAASRSARLHPASGHELRNATQTTVGSYRAVAYFVALASASKIPAAIIHRVARWPVRTPAAHQVAAATSSRAAAS